MAYFPGVFFCPFSTSRYNCPSNEIVPFSRSFWRAERTANLVADPPLLTAARIVEKDSPSPDARNLRTRWVTGTLGAAEPAGVVLTA